MSNHDYEKRVWPGRGLTVWSERGKPVAYQIDALNDDGTMMTATRWAIEHAGITEACIKREEYDGVRLWNRRKIKTHQTIVGVAKDFSVISP